MIRFDGLVSADLIVDSIYEGGSAGNAGDDPISKLLPGSGNQGGFRASGHGEKKNFVVLYTSGEDKDWPDRIDLNTGQFVYYGDNKTPGHKLHDTRRGGNEILRVCFDRLHSPIPDRVSIPPFFVFSKYPTMSSSRSVQFKGLAVPGYPGVSATEDLVAVWKTTAGQRFQNYRAVFTILDVSVIGKAWLSDITGNPLTANAPNAWRNWVQSGEYRTLSSESTTVIRSIDEQTPKTPLSMAILDTVYRHFRDTPVAFEAFAARLFQMHDSRVIVDKITRSAVDGGRDAMGRYLLGLSEDPVYAEFSLEAKCYRPPNRVQRPNTVGVKEVSRLISRIRHRQFGVLVTTSVIARQAYEEVREDRHPIIFISGKDISDILIRNGFNTPELVHRLLANEYPLEGKALSDN